MRARSRTVTSCFKLGILMPAPVELYRDSQHICLMFTDLVEEDGQAVQANQFLIVDN